MARALILALILAATPVAGLLGTAPRAGAAEPPTITGSAVHAAHGPGTIWFTYTVQVSSEVDLAELTTHQDALLSADPDPSRSIMPR
jgi:hypothetical protein